MSIYNIPHTIGNTIPGILIGLSSSLNVSMLFMVKKEKKLTDKLADKTAMTKFLQGIFGDAQKRTIKVMTVIIINLFQFIFIISPVLSYSFYHKLFIIKLF